MPPIQIFPIRPGMGEPIKVQLADAPPTMRERIARCMSAEVAQSLGLEITLTRCPDASDSYEALIFQTEVDLPNRLNAEAYKFASNGNLYQANVPGKLDAFEALIPDFKHAHLLELGLHFAYTIVEARLPVA